MTEPLKLGLAGLGTVGGGVLRLLAERSPDLSKRIGRPIEIVAVSALNRHKNRDIDISGFRFVADPVELARDPEIDAFVELIGGEEGVAKESVEAALRAGKHVVTANKALLAHHGPALAALAEKHGVALNFEGAVAGGIPVVKTIRESLQGNTISRVYGILNGTCNYILTRMDREGASYPAILAEAKALGYAEADESLDVDGWDTAHKASILAFLAHGTWVPVEKMLVEGITQVTQADLSFARENGYAIKLLAVITRDAANGEVFVRVHPALIPSTKVLANVNEVYNGISVTGDVVGETVYIGRGAGQDPTASAVISDIADAVILLNRGNSHLPELAETRAPLAPLQNITGRYYLRLEVKDEPGVLAKIAGATAKLDVSIASVLQRPSERPGAASLILTTHDSNEKAIRATVRRLGKLSSVLGEPVLLRIATFAG